MSYVFIALFESGRDFFTFWDNANYSRGPAQAILIMISKYRERDAIALVWNGSRGTLMSRPGWSAQWPMHAQIHMLQSTKDPGNAALASAPPQFPGSGTNEVYFSQLLMADDVETDAMKNYNIAFERIDPSASRYPYCIVWTPIPVLSWVIPASSVGFDPCRCFDTDTHM